MEPSHEKVYCGVIVKLELDPKMVQMNVYLSYIDDMLLVLLNEVEIDFKMTGELLNIKPSVDG